MPIKLALTALAFLLTPLALSAECSFQEHQAQSCAPGYTWDAESQGCVEVVSS